MRILGGQRRHTALLDRCNLLVDLAPRLGALTLRKVLDEPGSLTDEQKRLLLIAAAHLAICGGQQRIGGQSPIASGLEVVGDFGRYILLAARKELQQLFRDTAMAAGPTR